MSTHSRARYSDSLALAFTLALTLALVLVAVMLFVGIWPRSLSTGIDRALASPPAAAAASK